jgi:L-ascorbate metabolism protein UlaG (beta-lactamase superfamily)
MPAGVRLLSRAIHLEAAPMGVTIGRIALAASLAALAGCYTPTVSRSRSYHPSDADVSVTRIVHGSAIIDFRETRILLDPWYAPKPPLGQSETIGVALENLPPLRGILITHNHDDHFDTETLRDFPNKALRVIVKRGLGERVREMGYEDVVELDEWERSQIGSVIVTAVPSRHSAPENGYVLQANSQTLYVAGDTMYDEEMFRVILSRFGKLDAALLPIGGYRVFGRRLDMTPDEAADALLLLKPGHAIAYHYGLTGPFPVVVGSSEPEKQFVAAFDEKNNNDHSAVVILEAGESWHHYR